MASAAALDALTKEPVRVFRYAELEQKLPSCSGETFASELKIEAEVQGLWSKIGPGAIVAARGVGYRLRRIGQWRVAFA